MACPGAAVEGGEVDLFVTAIAFPCRIDFAIVDGERGTDVGADGGVDDLVDAFPGQCHDGDREERGGNAEYVERARGGCVCFMVQ